MSACLVILGKGVPNERALLYNHAAILDPSLILDTSTAILQYQNSNGHLSLPDRFGFDPLSESPGLLSERKTMMENNLMSPEELFGRVVNNSFQPFADALQYMIDVTDHLSMYL